MARENKTFLEARGAIQKKSYSAVTSNKYNDTQDTYSTPSTPVPQPNSSQISIYRKRRRNSPPLPDLSLQKQRELYNSFNKDINLPSSPIINDSTLHTRSGVNYTYVSQPTSPSLSSQNFSFSEKVRKTQPKDSIRNKSNTRKHTLLNIDDENNITKLILSVMKTVTNRKESSELPENELLDLIKIELKKNKSNSHGYEFD